MSDTIEREKFHKGDAVVILVNGIRVQGTVIKCYSRTCYMEDSRKNLHLVAYEQLEPPRAITQD